MEKEDQLAIPEEFKDAIYVVGRRLDNSDWRRLEGGPETTSYGRIRDDLIRLASHADSNVTAAEEGKPTPTKPTESLSELVKDWTDSTSINVTQADVLKKWLDTVLPLIDEDNKKEEARRQKLVTAMQMPATRNLALDILDKRTPIFVLYNNYFRVRPSIHLQHLAQRIATEVLDDAQYDYGNNCLLKLLGFSAKELSDLGKVAELPPTDIAGHRKAVDQLDRRSYQLNAASVRLTDEIRQVWNPDAKRDEANRLRIVADGQYLKVVVEDDLGVEVELHQRSEGFQWLVSFFIVFFAETAEKHANSILLLDEPGLSLHGLKQRDFRETISRLAEKNQTLYTTHSPFLVGPDELDLVRVVEMMNRRVGTKVHSTVTAQDPAALLPLQEALGYDLAQSLFAQQRNLVLEGLTDYWYLEAIAQLLRAAGLANLAERISLNPAQSAGKVVYYATILHAQKLNVAALLDSDSAGDQAARQEILIRTLGNKRILRTKDFYTGKVQNPEVEDMLRDSLIKVGKSELAWDVAKIAATQAARPIVDIFAEQIKDFSKYKLAKGFLRWTRNVDAKELTSAERDQWIKLINAINKALV